MATFDYDVIVIGSGAGGSVCARLLAKNGKSVAIIESEKLGGDYLNYAAIPVSALLESAHLYYSARNSDKFGLRGSTIGFNYPRVRAWKNLAIRRTGANETEKSLNSSGISVIHGSAHFIDSETITVGRARFKARYFVVASGAETVKLNIPGLLPEDFIDYKQALDLTRPPKTIAIIGGGVVGVEFASVFGSFGSKIYMIEESVHVLPNEDPLVGKSVAQNLYDKYGVNVIEKTTLQSGARRGRKKQLILKKAGKLHAIVVDEVMLATNKSPNTDIGLENAGVKYSQAGIKTDSHLKTSAKHIYAVGDVLGGNQSTHSSLYQGRLVAKNILQPKTQIHVDYSAMPRIILSSPEVATVGLSKVQLAEEKVKIKSATVDLSVVAKSYVNSGGKGFVKISVDQRTNKIVSAAIVAPHASEMIAELTLAIKAGLTAGDVAQTQHAFPTWSELIRLAATKLS